MKLDSVKPDPSSCVPKEEQIRGLFDRLAPVYDLGNTWLSFGQVHVWRRKAVRILSRRAPTRILDVACGTGDLSLALLKACPGSVITGIDFSEGMLQLARKKTKSVDFRFGEVTHLPFPDRHFGAVTVGFGLRNFTDIPLALKEMTRVLEPGGMLIILEATQARRGLRPLAFALYRALVLPVIGWLTGQRKAYHYLMQSMRAMPEETDLRERLQASGLTDIRCFHFCWKMCICFQAVRSQNSEMDVERLRTHDPLS